MAEALDQTGSITEEEAHNLIACHDLNRDGVIDYAGKAARDSSPSLSGQHGAGASRVPTTGCLLPSMPGALGWSVRNANPPSPLTSPNAAEFVSMLRAGEDSGGSDRSLRTIHRKHMVYSF